MKHEEAKYFIPMWLTGDENGPDLPEPEYMSAEDARFMLRELASKVNPGLLTAESRIAAALACHTEGAVSNRIGRQFGKRLCRCGWEWDIEADRCTSPTVKALLEEK